MVKRADQRSHSKHRTGSVRDLYVSLLREARTTLAACFSARLVVGMLGDG